MNLNRCLTIITRRFLFKELIIIISKCGIVLVLFRSLRLKWAILQILIDFHALNLISSRDLTLKWSNRRGCRWRKFICNNFAFWYLVDYFLEPWVPWRKEMTVLKKYPLARSQCTLNCFLRYWSLSLSEGYNFKWLTIFHLLNWSCY